MLVVDVYNDILLNTNIMNAVIVQVLQSRAISIEHTLPPSNIQLPACSCAIYHPPSVTHTFSVTHPHTSPHNGTSSITHPHTPPHNGTSTPATVNERFGLLVLVLALTNAVLRFFTASCSTRSSSR